VTVTAHVSSPAGFSADLRRASLTLDTVMGGPGSLTLSHTGSYPGGTMQTFEVVITSSATCGSSTNTIAVPTCCPNITFTDQVGPCDNNGNRSVTVSAQLSSAEPYTAEMHGPLGVLGPVAGPGTQTLTDTHSYPGSSSQTFSVVITSPAGCPGQSHTVAVPSCDRNGPNGFGLCAALLISAITLLVLGSALIIIGVCFSVGPLVIAGGIAAGIGLVLFILWAVLCSHFTSCGVMRVVHCILFFLITVVGPIILALALIFGGLPCQVAVAAAWGGWGTLYAWLGIVMGSVGCTKTC
jgi:hypothetical protein